MTPSASFWRHTATIYRKAWSPDSSLGMSSINADAGQTVLCTVQEQSQGTRPGRHDDNNAIVGSRQFDVLIPRVNPTTGEDQFPVEAYPSGPAIRIDDSIVWNGRTLRVSIDVDNMGRGGFGSIYTAYCVEIV